MPDVIDDTIEINGGIYPLSKSQQKLLSLLESDSEDDMDDVSPDTKLDVLINEDTGQKVSLFSVCSDAIAVNKLMKLLIKSPQSQLSSVSYEYLRANENLRQQLTVKALVYEYLLDMYEDDCLHKKTAQELVEFLQVSVSVPDCQRGAYNPYFEYYGHCVEMQVAMACQSQESILVGLDDVINEASIKQLFSTAPGRFYTPEVFVGALLHPLKLREPALIQFCMAEAIKNRTFSKDYISVCEALFDNPSEQSCFVERAMKELSKNHAEHFPTNLKHFNGQAFVEALKQVESAYELWKLYCYSVDNSYLQSIMIEHAQEILQPFDAMDFYKHVLQDLDSSQELLALWKALINVASDDGLVQIIDNQMKDMDVKAKEAFCFDLFLKDPGLVDKRLFQRLNLSEDEKQTMIGQVIHKCKRARHLSDIDFWSSLALFSPAEVHQRMNVFLHSDDESVSVWFYFFLCHALVLKEQGLIAYDPLADIEWDDAIIQELWSIIFYIESDHNQTLFHQLMQRQDFMPILFDSMQTENGSQRSIIASNGHNKFLRLTDEEIDAILTSPEFLQSERGIQIQLLCDFQSVAETRSSTLFEQLKPFTSSDLDIMRGHSGNGAVLFNAAQTDTKLAAQYLFNYLARFSKEDASLLEDKGVLLWTSAFISCVDLDEFERFCYQNPMSGEQVEVAQDVLQKCLERLTEVRNFDDDKRRQQQLILRLQSHRSKIEYLLPIKSQYIDEKVCLERLRDWLGLRDDDAEVMKQAIVNALIAPESLAPQKLRQLLTNPELKLALGQMYVTGGFSNTPAHRSVHDLIACVHSSLSQQLSDTFNLAGEAKPSALREKSMFVSAPDSAVPLSGDTHALN